MRPVDRKQCNDLGICSLSLSIDLSICVRVCMCVNLEGVEEQRHCLIQKQRVTESENKQQRVSQCNLRFQEHEAPMLRRYTELNIWHNYWCKDEGMDIGRVEATPWRFNLDHKYSSSTQWAVMFWVTLPDLMPPSLPPCSD